MVKASLQKTITTAPGTVSVQVRPSSSADTTLRVTVSEYTCFSGEKHLSAYLTRAEAVELHAAIGKIIDSSPIPTPDNLVRLEDKLGRTWYPAVSSPAGIELFYSTSTACRYTFTELVERFGPVVPVVTVVEQVVTTVTNEKALPAVSG